jgi:SpoVK/Ycf46/Vps4 family AAA+-type ATPase
LIGYTKTAVIMEYAEAIAPAGDPNFQSESDRSAIVTLHRWSSLPEIERGDNVVLLISENLTELAPKLISNPKVAVVEVPMPAHETRREAARLADTRLTEKDAERYAGITAGLKSIQIASILTPQPAAEEEFADREALIAALPDRLIAKRKREILERECFGLVEFVEPAHGFEVVGGMEEVKKDLMVIAESIREGRTSRVPMGILFTGPMGTGKTFVAEAFAKECGLTTIKLKNFRSKWVGATEGNLEKILNVIRAIGQVVVIIDEGDRAFGNTDGEGDGGTSSRVIARIKEFMSDTSNRGRILFLVMTNRPDKLDVDLKRAGRLDRKIPFLYVQTPEEVELVAKALLRKNKIKTDVDLSSIRESFSSKLVGYSNADIEAVLLLANEDAARESGGDAPVLANHFEHAAIDYFPSRDVELLEYMELLAVFESSSRRLLPAKYASLTPEELDTKLRQLRAIVGSRR